MTTRTGTSYFLNQNAALRYYAVHGGDRKEVARKIRDKEIFIGMPPKREGFRIVLNNKEGRYFYEEVQTAQAQVQVATMTSGSPINATTTPAQAVADLGAALEQAVTPELAQQIQREEVREEAAQIREENTTPPPLPAPTTASTWELAWPEPDPERAGMTLDEIKAAVDAGKTVHFVNDIARVVKDSAGAYMLAEGDRLVIRIDDGSTWNWSQFYIADTVGETEHLLATDANREHLERSLEQAGLKNETEKPFKPVAVVDDYIHKVVARFDTVVEAEKYIAEELNQMDPEGVAAGNYGIDAPEEMVNPPKPSLSIDAELRDAHEGSGSVLSFLEWLQEMAADPDGTLKDAAIKYLAALPRDRHRETASKMFGVKPEEVTPEQRKAGKNANFLVDYTPRLPQKAELEEPVITITTNNVPRELLFYSDLTLKEANTLGTREDTNSFFRLKGVVYDAGAFLETKALIAKEFEAWDGINPDAKVLIRYPRDEHGDRDPERVVIGTYTMGETKDPRAENNVPNLDDSMTAAELMDFHDKHDGGRRLKDLFPSGGEGTKNATADLANYAANKATAMGLRAKDKIAKAKKYEDICDTIYKSLPAWAKSW